MDTGNDLRGIVLPSGLYIILPHDPQAAKPMQNNHQRGHKFQEKGHVEMDVPRARGCGWYSFPGGGCMKRNVVQHFLLIRRAGREGWDKSHNRKARRAVPEVEVNRLYRRRERNQERR